MTDCPSFNTIPGHCVSLYAVWSLHSNNIKVCWYIELDNTSYPEAIENMRNLVKTRYADEENILTNQFTLIDYYEQMIKKLVEQLALWFRKSIKILNDEIVWKNNNDLIICEKINGMMKKIHGVRINWTLNC